MLRDDPPDVGAVVAALFVQKNGIYFGDDFCDPWDEDRDAARYAGDLPVVAHPPCRLAGLVEARWGHKRGDDGGLFASALATVRRVGGVLEHPAYSDAWPAYGLARPPRSGGWVSAGECGGFTCHVEQGRYGHVAKKATWLYYFSPKGAQPLDLLWGATPDSQITHLVSWCGNHVKAGEKRPRVGKKLASATPPEFKIVLVSLALRARGWA